MKRSGLQTALLGRALCALPGSGLWAVVIDAGSSRDNTITATPANPGALSDIYLRPTPGFGDINVSGPATTSRYG